MKRHGTILAIAACAAALSFQSCLKEQADTFEDPSAARLEEFLERTESILCNGEYWVMDYFTGKDQATGGYAFVLKFKDGKVSAMSELDPGTSAESLYKFTTDNGPVLSFDTYNKVLHYFATPSSSYYQARGGDFEFTIMDASPKKVTLLGKRNGNICTLRPLSEGTDPAAYLNDVVGIAEGMHCASFSGEIGGDGYNVEGTVNINKRRLTFTLPDGAVVEMPFTFTDTGIRAYETMCINGCHFQDLYYLVENNVLTNTVFALQCEVPEDYTPLTGFLGSFDIKYKAGTANVSISLQEDGTLLMKGLNPNFDVVLVYDKAKGRLVMSAQALGSNGDNAIRFCPWSAAEGYSYPGSDDIGLEIYRDMENAGRFKFIDNGVWETHKVDSFIVNEFDPDGNKIGGYSAWGTYQYAYFEYMEKKD